MQFERDPNEVAARYRVLKVGNDLKLSDGKDDLPVKRHAFSLSLQTTPSSLHWYVNEGKESFYTVNFLVADCSFRYVGDVRWSGDTNCFFVIDGEALRYAPLSELTVLSEKQFRIQRERIASDTGKAPSVDAHLTGELGPPLAYATITYCPARLGSAESLACTIGVPQSHFEKLVEGCLGGRIAGAYFHANGGVLLASFTHYELGSQREVIVLAEDEFNVRIDALSLKYRV